MNVPSSPQSEVTRLAALVAVHAPVGCIITDAEGRVMWMNESFAKTSGYTLDEMRGKRPGELLQGPLTTDDSRAIIAQALKTGEGCRTDIVNYAKDGTAYIVDVSLSAVRNEAGEICNFVSVQREVTAERAEPKENTDFKAYQKALDQQAIVSIADRRGRITYANKRFCEISEFRLDELVGTSHRIVNSGHHDRDFFKDMWRTIARGDIWHGEVCNRNKSGNLYWVDTTIVPALGADGKIDRYVSIRYDITNRKRSEERLAELALTDPLTGLVNRARFTEKLQETIEEAGQQEPRVSGAVVLIDIDHFKDLNDSLGHHAGDQLIKAMARRFYAFAGETATVARIGGDEFAMVLPLDGREPGGLSDMLRTFHDKATVAVEIEDRVYLPSISMGVTTYPAEADSAESAFINADIALYEAKRAGRNRWAIFDPQTRQALHYREEVKRAIRHGLDWDGFRIALHPIVRIADGTHAGFEILVRLDPEGPDAPCIPPAHFVPIAEQINLINEIGKTVVRQSLDFYNAAKAAGLSPGFIAINFSAAQLREQGFVETLQDLLWDYRVPPEAVVVELTETALVGRSSDMVAGNLERLDRLGIAIAMDDFGTGYSSLAHLKDFPVSKLKIDQSFTRDICADDGDRRLVEALVVMTKKLGMEVVAEGVETETQLALLRGFGCTYSQGFLHALPMSREDALAYLGERLAAQALTSG